MSEEARFSEERRLEQFRSVMQVSVLALRSAMVINGGAAVALLTFLGNMKDANGMSCFIAALQYFVVGVGLAAFATGTSYLAQYRYLYEVKNEGSASRGRYITYFTIAIVFCSYLVFVLGGMSASSGFYAEI